MKTDPTERFTSRVDNYARYRPGYPAEVIDFLTQAGNLNQESVIADVGSGTGILTALLLQRGFIVYGVEPNAAMKMTADSSLSGHTNFHSILASGEHTTLPEKSIDMITCATAFHWLNADLAREEFRRILKAKKLVALLWNIRRFDTDEFSKALGAIWTRYESGEKNDADSSVLNTFFEGHFDTRVFDNHQDFDLEGLTGRVFSSSLSPSPETPAGTQYKAELVSLFERFQQDGHVRMHYGTKVYIGRVHEA